MSKTSPFLLIGWWVQVLPWPCSLWTGSSSRPYPPSAWSGRSCQSTSSQSTVWMFKNNFNIRKNVKCKVFQAPTSRLLLYFPDLAGGVRQLLPILRHSHVRAPHAKRLVSLQCHCFTKETDQLASSFPNLFWAKKNPAVHLASLFGAIVWLRIAPIRVGVLLRRLLFVTTICCQLEPGKPSRGDSTYTPFKSCVTKFLFAKISSIVRSF